MTSPELEALSPVDGRYAAQLAGLRALCSEAGLIRQRVRVEALWWQQLCANLQIPALQNVPERVSAEVERLAREPASVDADAVKAIEQRINHDVKAVEYYVRERLQAAGATAAQLEFVHFGCTSEDINNLSYALMLHEARGRQLLPAMSKLAERLRDLAHEHAATPMLARTHGQTASPTTLGKEIANFVARLDRQQTGWAEVRILGKFNGAVGNFNAHLAGVPDADWLRLGRNLVESLGLEWNAYTTQIEPHDWIAEYCDALARHNTILIDLCRDFWGYISLGYFRQRVVAQEVGSSTMPHKVNPIDFENAEGNLGLANALLRHFAEKLPISRWQRDLTDSTVLRNLGVALGHSLLATQATSRGLARLEVARARLQEDLEHAWEVLAEAVQTAMRAEGIADGYEKLKEFSRGRMIDREQLHAFIGTLQLSSDARRRLLALTPQLYLGLAPQLAREI
ncbi:MAG TPA: adenylosuccinate lyase [Steroidobacteraceae bacterium]|nr:adenylosuccinate lyase [Steroidobacteraceae bacterium]